MRSDVERT